MKKFYTIKKSNLFKKKIKIILFIFLYNYKKILFFFFFFFFHPYFTKQFSLFLFKLTSYLFELLLYRLSFPNFFIKFTVLADSLYPTYVYYSDFSCL